MRIVKFGIIGTGLMGKEFACAAARWCHLPEMKVRPEIVSICDKNVESFHWFQNNFKTITQVTDDYNELLSNPDVEAVYIAVPHHLHEEFYSATIKAGKHLMGEKPFGIDKEANNTIMQIIKENPETFVRCSSQFPFTPAVQRIGEMIEADAFGEIIEVNSGFLHSSDLDQDKSINWKRMIQYNGEYGCMGDLGMHACHMVFKAGWVPLNVRAVLSNIIKQRPDGKGNLVSCETWDNAMLLCETRNPKSGQTFPWTFKTQRIAPGEKNTWYFEVLGTKSSAKFSTKQINTLHILEYNGGEQIWQTVDMGHETAFKSITGGIFEIGFSDLILQMWAAFLYELDNGKPETRFSGCVTPEETALSHWLFTAALESQARAETIELVSI